ncbi:NUDIX domain-containing protein [Streptomyces sp. NPDC048491]|uniref:NUDIX domain-containing protein n=1 Tax=Streptomyces sp. NPDC048491 TaxID=3157207 RepID=UPI0034419D32
MPPQPHIVGVHLVFEQAGCLLLQQRSPDAAFGPDAWHLPAGHLDEDESAEACAVREAGEELGVLIDPQDLRLVHVLHYRQHTGATPRLQLFYRVLDHRGTPKICEPDCCAALGWHAAASLPSPLVDYAAVALTAIAANHPSTTMGWGA